MSDADVHQLTGFMAAFEPQRLRALQLRHPDEPLLRPGMQLGRLSASMLVRVELASHALAAMVSQGDALADRLASRIRVSHRAELVAQVAGLIGSGGVLAVLLGDGSEQLKLAAALLGVLGSTTALLVKFLRRDLGGTDDGLVAQHAALVRAVANAVETAERLRPHERTRSDLGDAVALARVLDEANTLAGRMYLLMKQAGAVSPEALRGEAA